MKLKTLKGGMLLVGLTMVLMGSSRCRREETRWVADFWVGSPESGSIVNERGQELSCIDEQFINYGCLHIDKINELRRVLKKRCK